jgi:type II secretory pathway component PulM
MIFLMVVILRYVWKWVLFWDKEMEDIDGIQKELFIISANCSTNFN